MPRLQPRGPRAVVAEGQDQRDAHEAAKQALENMVAELKSDGMKASMETYEVRAGNQLIDMFRSSYWAMAFNSRWCPGGVSQGEQRDLYRQQ